MASVWFLWLLFFHLRIILRHFRHQKHFFRLKNLSFMKFHKKWSKNRFPDWRINFPIEKRNNNEKPWKKRNRTGTTPQANWTEPNQLNPDGGWARYAWISRLSQRSVESGIQTLESKPRNPNPGNQAQEYKPMNPIPGIRTQEAKLRNPNPGIRTQESKPWNPNRNQDSKPRTPNPWIQST